jgi:spore coat protein U-like protein
MMNRTSKIVLTTSAMFLALFVGRPQPAQAVGITSNVTVTANVTRACTISDATLGFGTYDPSNTSDTVAQGTLGFRCSSGVSMTIDLGTGSNSVAAGSGLRGMANAGNVLPYQIYSDSARTTVWGTGMPTGTSVSKSGTGGADTVIMYGKIPLGKTTVIDGAYQDIVVATLNF